MNVEIESSWKEQLADEFEEPYFKQTRIAMLRADKQEELIAILESCRERLKGLGQTY